MNEKTFNSEISRSFRKDNIWYYKIPDIGRVLKPFDRVVEIDTKLIGIEEKLVKGLRFYFRNVRPHQWNNLRDLNYGFLLINFRWRNINRAFLLYSWEAWVLHNIQVSITMEECIRKDIIEVRREGKYWHITEAIRNAIRYVQDNR